MGLRLKIPPLTLIEIHHAWVCEQAYPFRAHLMQGLKDVNHHLFPQAIALIKGVNCHIPNGGLKNAISRTPSESNKPGDPGVMAP
jgi:hypothetical protein